VRRERIGAIVKLRKSVEMREISMKKVFLTTCISIISVLFTGGSMTKKVIFFVIGLGLFAVFACTNEGDSNPSDQQFGSTAGNSGIAGTLPAAGTNAFPDQTNNNVPASSGSGGSQAPIIDPQPTAGSISPPIAGAGGQAPVAGSPTPPIAGVGGVPVAGSGGVVAGSGGVVAGSGGGDVGGTGGTVDIRPPCLKDPSQVVLLGDSYMNAPAYVGRAIVAAAVADGALRPGQTYKDYSDPGTLVTDGAIPGQLDRALRENPNVKTYIATGCGNDILIGGAVLGCLFDGASTNPVCTEIIAMCTQAFKDMAIKASAVGVTDAIVFYYPDNVPGGGGDIARYGSQAAAEGVAEVSTPEFRAYFVDSIPLLKDHPDYFSDLIHVDQRGAKLIGDAVYQVMKDHCIAQPESSGCCEPW
jgi:hypothetical protein